MALPRNRMRTPILRTLPFALALLVAGPLPLPSPSPALAAEVVRDTALGGRVADTIAAGDVHVWQVAAAAGTEIRCELRSEDGADKDGDDGDGPRALLVLVDPQCRELGRAQADDDDLRRVAPVSGTYRLEVRAGGFSGGYELRIEGRADEGEEERVRTQVVLTGDPVTVHVAAPAQGSLEIEVRRRSGGAPQVDQVTDALGRPLGIFPREARRTRVRLLPIPVGVEGGLDVTLSASGDGTGRFELRTRVRGAGDRLRGGDEHEERRIVVQLAPGTDAAALAATLGATLVEVRGDLAVLETSEDREGFEHDDAAEFDLLPGVLGAEANLRLGNPEGSQSNAVIVGSELGRSNLEQQAALADLRAAVAHRAATGKGCVVAVLDGGVDLAHPFLEGRLLPGHDVVGGDEVPAEETNGLDDDADGLVDEGFGHGTFVASLVLAAAPEAKVLPVRVLDTDGRGTAADVAAGITWAVDHGADVLNCSFGSLGGSTTIASAVRYAVAKGVVVVAATGNDGSTTVVDFPAAMPEVVSVSAVDATGGRADFANAGPATTLAAPGATLVGAYPDGLYAEWSGTSFSSALVSGGSALVVQGRPLAAPQAVKQQIVRRARPVRRTLPSARRRGLGAGVLDLARLVK